jgi:hypothetical protein
VLPATSGGGAGQPPVIAGPVTVASRPLADLLDGASVLVSPPELPLLRCTAAPRVAAGVAAVPDAVIGFELHDRIVEIPELDSATGPWFLLRDAVPMRELVAWLTDEHPFAVTVRVVPPGVGG